jgi:sn-glycerol 3-phosphate transport system permease protein
MVERTPILNLLTQMVLLVGFIVLLFPIIVVIIASTHDFRTVNQVPMSLIPGEHLLANWSTAWNKGNFGTTMLNSLAVSIIVTVGKISIAAITAFGLVYFRHGLRVVFFWLIFMTLMLPLEVRIVPTYAVAADALRPFKALFSLAGIEVGLPQWNLLNSYTGLTLPLIATATGTFLYRQFFLTVPDELAEAAKMDGAGPLRFFWDTLIPLSKTNIAALAVIMFVYSWNQFLWPLLVVNKPDKLTATVMLDRLVPGPLFGQPPIWNEAMAATLIVMIPPLLVVIVLQRWFIRGLVQTDK